jgi:hypothetical protein
VIVTGWPTSIVVAEGVAVRARSAVGPESGVTVRITAVGV